MACWSNRIGKWVAVLALFAFTQTPQVIAQGTDTAVFDDYWQELLDLRPDVALSQGDYRHLGRFDRSLESTWRKEMLALIETYQARLGALDYGRLNEGEQISFDVLSWRLQLERKFLGSDLFVQARMLPLDHFRGQHISFAESAAGAGTYPFETQVHYEQALVRAEGFARWVDDAIARLGEGVEAGVVLPRLVVVRVLPQLAIHFDRPPRQTQFWAPLQSMPSSIDSAAADDLRRRHEAVIADVIQPAYRRLFDYLQDDYLPHARDTVGLTALPSGQALYQHYVRTHTTTDMDAEEVHALGRAEVSRIMEGFRALQQQLGIEGDVQALFEHARNDSTLYYSDDERDQIVPDFNARRDDIVGLLPKMFDLMPKAAYEIRALPDSSRSLQGNGYFQAASADGSRPGILWINIHSPGITSRFNLTTLSVHEGLPGHHFQTAIAREVKGVPAFRRFESTTAFGEGWALYAESLAGDLGLLDDPWQRYGYLNYEMMRANRLVIDTGIHALGWSIDEGVQWMLAHSSMSEAESRAEVERYAAYPGQALAYKIGELKIQQLRARAETQLGEDFDLPAFHRTVLLTGSVPMAVLEGVVDRWLAGQGQASP